MEQKDKKLYKSNNNKVIGGVCGGLGEYLGIDPVILRIIAVVLIFCHGVGLILYLIAWICMPKQAVYAPGGQQEYGGQQYNNEQQQYYQNGGPSNN
jgi:phage shock protein C